MMMTDKKPGLPPGTVRSRIDRICRDCGYSSVAELGEIIGQSRSNMNQWQQRNTYGPGGASQLADISGADMNWLYGRDVEPFPNGPKINPALKVQNVYSAITANRRVAIALARAIHETMPDTARAWRTYLEQEAQDSFSGVLLDVLKRLDNGPVAPVVPISAKPARHKPK